LGVADQQEAQPGPSTSWPSTDDRKGDQRGAMPSVDKMGCRTDQLSRTY